MTAATLRPRPHQVQALTDLMAAFAIHDRAQLVMACGTGKTLVGRWHAQASAAQTVLVLVPSLALLAQTLTEWRRANGWPFDALVVCSDPTTEAGTQEHDDDEPAPNWSTTRAQVTTDAKITAAFLTRQRTRPGVVFATYHSAPVIAHAQAATRAVFDLVICDEAHRLAGSPRAEFRTALHPRQIVARHRLFMTATPRLATGTDEISMDDPTLFGPVAHSVSFGDAITAGLLCDYRVAVLGVPADSVVDDTFTGAPAALLSAIDHYDARRVLTFHGRVAKAAAFAATLDHIRTPGGSLIRARHLSGAMPTEARMAGLEWLREPGADEIRVVSNARVLAEGVDAPAVDTVVFCDQRSSVVDIIQAVGRVLRPSPGKQVGTIVVPIGLPEGGDDDTELLVSRFGLLWSVLRSLRAHDDRFASEVADLVHHQVRHPLRRAGIDRVEYVLPTPADQDEISLRLIQEVSEPWERFHAALEDWAWSYPGDRVIRQTVHRGLSVGEWAAKQRKAQAAGLLPQARLDRLEQIPGWFWDWAEAGWDDTYELLRSYARTHGGVAEAETAPSRFEGMKSAPPNKEHLSTWMARQRQAFRSGLLEQRRAELLDQLPGWSWTPIPAADLHHVDALAQFVEFEHHARVPDRHVEDGLELGRWCWDVRRRKLTGRLHPALEAEILACTPSVWRTGGMHFGWQQAETQWRLAYTALCAFARREGHAAPPGRAVEDLPDATIRIGQWVALQRHLRGRGELSDQRTVALEGLTGWAWAADPNRSVEAPLDLPVGLEHGRAGAIARGCHCHTCRQANRTQQRDYKRAQRVRAVADAVPAGPAAGHVAEIETQLGAAIAAHNNDRGKHAHTGRRVLAAASGVPLGVVRHVLNDPTCRISRADADALVAVSLEACMAQLSATGSRGRLTQQGSTRVSAAPSWELINDLTTRGFNRAWIGRELGYPGSLQLGTERCSESLAHKIADLHRRVGTLRAPTVRRIPPLSDLKPSPEGAPT